MWNKEFLLKKRSQYKKLLKRCNNPEDELRITNTLYSIEYVLDFMYATQEEESVVSFKDMCREESDFLSYYRDLVPYVSSFAKKYSNDEFFEFRELKEFKTDTDDVLKMTSEFYNTLDKRFSKPFNRVFDKNKQWVKYVNGNGDCYTFPIYYTNVILMLLSRYNTIEDYKTALHEYGHCIDITYNQEQIEAINRIPFAEVVSIFMELINTPFLEEHFFSPKELLSYDINSFTKYLEVAIVANEKHNIANTFNSSKIFSNKQAIKYLKDKVHMEDFGIEQVLYDPISELFPYVISYQIAIELYLIYLQDKKEALNIVYTFMSLKGCTVKDYIDFFNKSGVEIGKNTDQYVKILKNRNDSISYGI